MTFNSAPKDIEVVNLSKTVSQKGISLSKVVMQTIKSILERNPILSNLGILIRQGSRVK